MSDQIPHSITKLVSTALRHNQLSALSKMLESFTKAVDAYGCILWQVVPGAKLDRDAPCGYLFVLAEWFPDKKSDPLHDLPIARSITGKVVLNNELKNVKDIKEEMDVYRDDPFLSETGIRAFCSVPIRFRSGTLGAVNLYRNEDKPFSDDEVQQIEKLASLIPSLYKAIRDKVNFTVIRKINKILDRAEQKASAVQEPPSKEEVKKVIQKICNLVTNTFKCIETSIFLEDRLVSPGEYELMATTWPDFIVKNSYTKDMNNGITGWLLATARHVQIFDLAHFDRDRKAIQEEYPGLQWVDRMNIGSAVRRVRELDDQEALPPLSFMAAPIIRGNEVLGAIRCSVAKEGPYYFADLALMILKLAAAQISRYWSNWLSKREKQEDIRSWEALIKSVGEMNRFAQVELTRPSPNERNIISKTLEVTNTIIRGAEIIDVRLLLDEREQALYFAETHGKYWSEGDQRVIRERKQQRFLLSETSAESYVLRTGKVYVMSNVDENNYYSAAFPGIKRLIIAPIKVADKKFGVLDIRSIGEQNFPSHAVAVAELLGQQLGLFHYLATTIRQLRQTQIDLRAKIGELTLLEEEQLQIFVDLKHQIYSPINLAYARLQLFKDEFPTVAESTSMLRIRGLFGKTRRIAMNTALIENLARKKPIAVEQHRLHAGELVNMLIGSALNSHLMMRPKYNVNFEIDKESLNVLDTHEVNVDKNLLEHAIMNVTDNAFKYSFSNNNVHIMGALSKRQYFYVSIRNTGIAMTEHDKDHCLERGYRGIDARKVTGEGSGIGLWIVDNIMKAHGGMLEIYRREKQTEVRLLFLLAKK